MIIIIYIYMYIIIYEYTFIYIINIVYAVFDNYLCQGADVLFSISVFISVVFLLN